MSIKHIAERFWSKVKKTKSCWLWTASKYGNGYGHIRAGAPVRKHLLAHRVSWEIHNGPVPAGMCVCHKCDIRDCVNPRHLFLASQQENIIDAARKGRLKSHGQHKGELNGSAKLTAVDVAKIRSLSIPQIEIARLFGINQTHVSRIKARQNWRHV